MERTGDARRRRDGLAIPGGPISLVTSAWSAAIGVRTNPSIGILISAQSKESTSRLCDRRVIALERVPLAHAALSACRLCPHDCGVNRLADERGRCHAGATARVFSAQVEVGDELELIPTFAIAFSGCDMRCAFCITGADSWNPQRGEPFDPTGLAAKATKALQLGASTV